MWLKVKITFKKSIHTTAVTIEQLLQILGRLSDSQARQTRPNSGGVAEGHPRFDKGGVAIIFYFLRVKNITF